MLFLKEIRNRYGNKGSVAEPPLFGQLRLWMANVLELTPNVKKQTKKTTKAKKENKKNTKKTPKKHQKTLKKKLQIEDRPNWAGSGSRQIKAASDGSGSWLRPTKIRLRLRSRPKSGGSRRLRLCNTEHRYGSY